MNENSWAPLRVSTTVEKCKVATTNMSIAALPPQDIHLMSQRDELEFQGGAATKPEAEYGNDGGKNRDHARDGRAVAQKSPAFLGPSEF
jgi:hypothetical protein